MKKVGRLISERNEINQVEWKRIISVKPVKYGAILAITKPGESCPERYPEVDWSIVCKQCDGTGQYPSEGTICQECGGNGRKKIMPMQKPRIGPPKPLFWTELSPLGRLR